MVGAGRKPGMARLPPGRCCGARISATGFLGRARSTSSARSRGSTPARMRGVQRPVSGRQPRRTARAVAEALARPRWPRRTSTSCAAERSRSSRRTSATRVRLSDRAWRTAESTPPGHQFHAPADRRHCRRAFGHGRTDPRLSQGCDRTGRRGTRHRRRNDPQQAAKEAADRAFGDWPKRAKEPRREPCAGHPRVDQTARSSWCRIRPESDVIIGWPGLPRTDPRFTAARVTNMVYAADTFASRAGQRDPRSAGPRVLRLQRHRRELWHRGRGARSSCRFGGGHARVWNRVGFMAGSAARGWIDSGCCPQTVSRAFRR